MALSTTGFKWTRKYVMTQFFIYATLFYIYRVFFINFYFVKYFFLLIL